MAGQRAKAFQALLGGKADLAFIPICTDLDYLAGIPRDIPNYGVTLHPGGWLEGAWLTPPHAPVLALPRMTAEFRAAARARASRSACSATVTTRPRSAATSSRASSLPARPRVAVSDQRRTANRWSSCRQILPDAVFVSATEILRELRVIKSRPRRSRR